MILKSTLRYFLVALVALTTACKKDHRVLDSSVQPAEDGLNTSVMSGLPVFMHTQLHEPAVSFNNSSKYLGSHNDAVLGKTDIGLYMSIYTNLSDPKLDPSDITGAEIILALADQLDNKYGDASAKLSYSVHPVDSTLSSSRAYTTDNDRLHNAAALVGSATEVAESIVNKRTIIKIPLDAAYAQTMLNDLNGQSFANYIGKHKGFYIRAGADGKEGVIYKCNLQDSISGLYLHYKKKESAETGTFQFGFSGTGTARFNTVKYDPATAVPSLKGQLAGDSTQGSQNVFLKGMGILQARVYIPFLRNYGDTFNIAVNRAEVILNVDALTGGNTYAVPRSLALLPVADNGGISLADDQLNATDNLRYDGKYDAQNNRYVFNIARHAQAILKGERKNNGFRLVVAESDGVTTLFLRDIFIQRVVLAGHNTNLKPVFNLSYSKIK